MASCNEMRKGEVYACEDCGLELEVIKECKEAGTASETSQCAPCPIMCCGEELKKKG